MAIEVLLMSEVEGLGKEGDVVRVKDGFARNFLFPKQLAAPVTDATRRRLEKMRKDRSDREASELHAARDLAARLEKSSCTVPMKTGSEGKLFGAVTVAHIAEVLKKDGFELDRHQIELVEPIRELGVFSVPVHLHPQVTASLKVWVTGE